MMGAYGAGTVMTGGTMVGGMVIGTGIDTVTSGLWKVSGLTALQESLQNRGFIEDIGQVVAKGTGATLSGHGFRRGEIRGLNDFMQDATKRFDMSLEDVQKEMVGFINEGLFKNSSNVDEFKKQFGQLKKNVKDIIETLGTTQEEAITLMSDLNQSGMSSGGMMLGIRNAQQLSRRTGIATSAFLDAGQATAQSFQGTGLSADAGFNIGMGNLGAVQRGIQLGNIGANTQFQTGGSPDQIAWTMTQKQMQYLNQPLAQYAMRAAMTDRGTIDPLGFLRYSQMGATEVYNAAIENMRGIPGSEAMFVNNLESMKSTLVSQDNGLLNTAMLGGIYRYAAESGVDPQYLATQQFGMTNAEWDLLHGVLQSTPSPRGTLQEQQLAKRARENITRQYIRYDGPLRTFGRGVGYGLGQISEGLMMPFTEAGAGISGWVEDIITPNDIMNMIPADRRVALEAMKRTGTRFQDNSLYGGNIWSDDFGIDNSEILRAGVQKGLFTNEDIGRKSISEAYVDKNVRKAVMARYGISGYAAGVASDRIALSQLRNVVTSAEGYEDALIVEDQTVLGSVLGRNAFSIIQNESVMRDVVRASNNVSGWAVDYGRIEDKTKAETIEMIAGKDIGDLRRLLIETKNRGMMEDYASVSMDKKMSMLFKATGIKRSDITSKKEMNTFLNMIESTTFGGLDTEQMSIVEFGIAPEDIEALNKIERKNLEDFTDELEGIRGINLRSKSERYLKSDEIQHKLHKLMLARSRGADDNEIQKIQQSILSGTEDDKIRADVGRLLEVKDSVLYGALEGRFGMRAGLGTSLFEQEKYWESKIVADGLGSDIGLTPDEARAQLVRGGFGSRKDIKGWSDRRVMDMTRIFATAIDGEISGGKPSIEQGLGANQIAVNMAIALNLQAMTETIKSLSAGNSGPASSYKRYE
jgi:hypothetical protein